MPQIPDPTRLTRATPQSRRGAVSLRSSDPVPGALGEIGRALSQGADDLQQAADQWDYANAKAEYLNRFSQLETELSEREDFDKFGDEYDKRSTEIRQASLDLIRNPGLRSRFEIELDEQVEIRRGRVREIAQKKEADFGRGRLSDISFTLRQTALNAKTDRERAAALETYADAVVGARKNGWISAEDEAQMMRNYAVSYAEGAVSMMPAAERVEVLSKASHPLSSKMQPDKRAALLNSARDELAIDNVRTQGAARADEIMALGLPKSKALAQTRKIKDGRLRDDVRRRVELRYDEAAEAQRERIKDLVSNSIEIAIDQGTDAIPADVEAELKRQNKWQTVVRASQPDKIKTDWEVHDRIINMEPDELTALDPLQYRDRLADTEFRQVQKLVQKARDGDLNDLTNTRTIGQMKKSALASLGIKPNPKPKHRDAKRVDRFERAVQREVNLREAGLGRKLKGDELQAAVDSLVIEVHYNGPEWFDEVRKSRFELTIDDVPRAERALIEEAFAQVPGEKWADVLGYVPADLNDQAIIDIFAAQNEKQP